MVIGSIDRIQIKREKGGPIDLLDKAILIEGYGIKGNYKGGKNGKQISLLSREDVKIIHSIGAKGLCTKRFSSDFIVEGMGLATLSLGNLLSMGDAKCEVVSMGKVCYIECPLRQSSGPCCVSHMGVFLKVINSGIVSLDDKIIVLNGEL